MNNVIIASIAGAIAVGGTIGAAIFLHRRKLQQQFDKETELIEGTLHMDDIISYFRGLDIKEGSDSPFIANGEADQFKKLTKGLVKPKDGYKLLMTGCFNASTDEITHCKFIYSLDWSEDLVQIMGNEPFVVLS